MREIKFRAWDKENKKMVAWATIECWRSHEIKMLFFEENYSYEKLEYTGLKDKNGVEIYISDVIRGWNGMDMDEPIEVSDSYMFLATLETGTKMDNTIEVIGNIYEDEGSKK